MDNIRSHRRRKELSSDPAWRAVFTILDRLGPDGRVWEHVDLTEAVIDFKAMLEEGTFSGGERRLIEIAASIFNQEHKVNLYWALGGLDEESAAAVEKAIHTFNNDPSGPDRMPNPNLDIG